METMVLSFQEMAMTEGGKTNWGCVSSLGLAVTIWSVGFGMVNPVIGGAISFLGGLAVSAVCDN
ncbi:MAG: hypothetical protein GXY51_11545 [Bacteroidetes bacterium]|nr:hypothetical protein [Bacteroidota bacterium]